MASNLGRLFRFARTSENDARENFITEALAAAIREDAAPMVSLLEQRNVIAGGAQLVPHTQVTVPGTGVVDLVLTVVAQEKPLFDESMLEAETEEPKKETKKLTEAQLFRDPSEVEDDTPAEPASPPEASAAGSETTDASAPADATEDTKE